VPPTETLYWVSPHPVTPTPESAYGPHLEAEAARVWELWQAGVIREMYFRADQHTAVMLLECEDREEAGQVLRSLPLMKNGLITFEVIPLKPYDGFSRLFSK
jgi:muconolactone delta-isomerase